MNIWSVLAVHMWTKASLPFMSFLLLFLRRLFEQWTPTFVYIYIYIYFCHEQCYFFKFPSLAVILKCSPALLISSLIRWLTRRLLSLRFYWCWYLREVPFTFQPLSPFLTQTLSPFPFLHRVLPFKHFNSFTPINHCIMTPAKGQSSSHRKGKEIASDPPTARNVGEEAVYSESDHSDEEET